MMIFYINKLGYTKRQITKNKILVKDKDGNTSMVDINDPLYISGELTSFWAGRHRTEKTKQKLRETFLKIHHLQGEKNSQYGTCWVYNNEKAIKIKKEQLEEYISNGWNIGRKDKILYKRIWVHNNEKNIKTSEKYVQDYLDKGYIIGYNKNNKKN